MGTLIAHAGRRRIETPGYDADLVPAPEQVLDDITAIAAELCRTPVAQISFVDDDRHWSGSRSGRVVPPPPRDFAFCAHALAEAEEFLEVPDTRLDYRFVDNPLVIEEPGIRFYAGTRLVSPQGHALGTLCVMDHEPRRLDPGQAKSLRALGRQVVRELERRRLGRLLASEADARARLLDEERLSSHALHAKSSMLEAVMATSSASITVLDLDGQITYANPNAEVLLGLVRNERLPCRYDAPGWKITAPDGGPWPEDLQPFRRILCTGQAVHGVEHAIEWPDGRRRQLSVSGAPIRDESGAIASLLFSAVDLTQRHEAELRRKQLESRLNHVQKMETIGALASGIAHEFNNMLSAILGNALLATQDLDEAHPALRSLNEIQRAGSRVKGLVEKIVAYGRRSQRAPRRQALAPLISETIGMLRAILPAGVRIEARLCDAPLEVDADHAELDQMLVNLCINAWQSMDRRAGRVVIGLQPVPADGTGADVPREAHIWVSDNGRGMDAAMCARIFEPFFTTRALEGSTGLGLSVVQGIVAAHGGRICVDSRPGVGTTVNIRLPLSPANRTTGDPEPAADASVSTQRPVLRRLPHVLYVDDEEAMVALMKRLLERRGYRVTCFTCANDALAAVALAPHAFDVVVTDYNMPSATGLDVARKIAAFWPQIKVIITSGHVDDRLAVEAAKAGVSHVLCKPDSIQSLSAAIDVSIRDSMSSGERQ